MNFDLKQVLEILLIYGSCFLIAFILDFSYVSVSLQVLQPAFFLYL